MTAAIDVSTEQREAPRRVKRSGRRKAAAAAATGAAETPRVAGSPLILRNAELEDENARLRRDVLALEDENAQLWDIVSVAREYVGWLDRPENDRNNFSRADLAAWARHFEQALRSVDAFEAEEGIEPDPDPFEDNLGPRLVRLVCIAAAALRKASGGAT